MFFLFYPASTMLGGPSIADANRGSAVIKIDWTLLLQVVNFVVLLVILQRLVFQPLRKLVGNRQSEIDGSLNRVKELESEIQSRQTIYAERLASVRDAERQRREATRQEAAAQQAQLVSVAHEEATARMDELTARIAAEQASAAESLASKVDELAGAIVRKIAGRAL